MEHDHQEPMAQIAGKLMKTKKILETTGALSTKTFDGFGKDQSHKLRMEALKASTGNDVSVERKRDGAAVDGSARNKQKGGFAIAPWFTALLLSANVKVTKRVVDFIADKMQCKR